MLARSPEYVYLGVQSCSVDLLAPTIEFGFQDS